MHIPVQGNIVILTGAGISAESGLATFRAQDGLWENHRVEDVATPQGFARNPERVQEFYNTRRRQLKDATPNAAHYALAQLEEKWLAEVLLITQNVDDLHERAGSKRLIHMHGELKKAQCVRTGKIYEWEEDITPSSLCGCCQKAGTLRPHIVWFGEMPLEMERIYEALAHAGLFLSVGTSGNVYPAAGFVQEVRMRTQAHTVELNLEPSLGGSFFAEKKYGPASKLVPEYVSTLLSAA